MELGQKLSSLDILSYSSFILNSSSSDDLNVVRVNILFLFYVIKLFQIIEVEDLKPIFKLETDIV